MDFSGTLSGSAPLLRKVQVAATTAYAGIPHLVVAAAGATAATTTGAADMIGVNLDKVTYTTTQGTGTSTAERLATFVTNPDAIYRARLSGGAASGTALAIQTTTSASSGGTAITTGATWTGTEFDQGLVWAYSGANVGQHRIITSTSSTAGTVTQPFDFPIAIGDQFIRSPILPFGTTTAQLTTELYEIDATIAVGTGAPFACVDATYRDASAEGTTKSYVWLVARDHYLNPLS